MLFHTDLSRSGGTSNGLDLDGLNWGNYDLVVIDESHNFRNGAGTHANTQENRYIRLMDRVIRAGVRTKVMMLSATPANNLTQQGREQGIRRLMSINLLKQLESSVYSFQLTLTRILALITGTIKAIDDFEKYGRADIDMTEASEDD